MRVLTKAMFLAVLVGLSGCANVKDLQSKDPVYFGTTNKSPQDYAACVAQSWKQLGREVQLKPISNGVDIVVAGRFNVDEVLRAQFYRNTTQISMHARTQYNYQELVQAANLCAG